MDARIVWVLVIIKILFLGKGIATVTYSYCYRILTKLCIC